KKGDYAWEEIGPPMPNPHGRIPGQFWRQKKNTRGLWVDSYGSMLTDVAIAANCGETLVEYNSRSQVKFLGGEFKDFPPGQVLAQARAVTYGNAENINVL